MRANRRKRVRFLLWAVAAAAILTTGGCTRSLMKIPFDVARHAAVESACLPIDAAEIAATGILDALLTQR